MIAKFPSILLYLLVNINDTLLHDAIINTVIWAMGNLSIFIITHFFDSFPSRPHQVNFLYKGLSLPQSYNKNS